MEERSERNDTGGYRGEENVNSRTQRAKKIKNNKKKRTQRATGSWKRQKAYPPTQFPERCAALRTPCV